MGLIRLDPYGDANGNLDYWVYINNQKKDEIPAAHLPFFITKCIASNFRLTEVAYTEWPGILGYSFDDIESIVPGLLDV